jgi:hypothetical protein
MGFLLLPLSLLLASGIVCGIAGELLVGCTMAGECQNGLVSVESVVFLEILLVERVSMLATEEEGWGRVGHLGSGCGFVTL